ncbi:phosphatidate cytidylyltransferase [Microvirga thermotolerans]|uniref:Phosphatidate cytidylyltransferase n=1 Tax=Microvirga thermotolerans TaxID=2651334 RepID=A0A5P9JUA8_9HYPH|nr:phosphatidate cytidylyltransferase [Microvirga thermotolerans]QFU16412.1 phosphatidate cytidylyltransferase [Microvirga thermotolerans]
MAPDEGAPPSPDPAGKPRSELAKRVASAVVLIPLALAVAWEGGWAFALFWLAAGIAMMVEWTNMTRVEPRRPVQAALGLGLAALTFALLNGLSLAAGTAVLVATAVLGAALARGGQGKLWAVGGFAYGAVIVLVPPIVREHPYLGLVGLLWMFAVVWATDIAAYFTGRRLGGPKLWPRVSPKKTWSGFAGGLVAGTLGGFLVVWVSQRFGWIQPFSLRNTVLLSIVASVASQLGDLGESALKRHCDVKDSSHLIPGHGGVMDRLDGFWAVSLILGAVLLTVRLAT